MNYPRHLSTSKRLDRHQRGAALIVSLLILLVLTVLGIASMGTTTLQERMANNNRQRQVAFQVAEVALRAAETFLATNITSVATLATSFNAGTPVAGLYSQRPPVTGASTRPLVADIYKDTDWLAAGNTVLVTSVTNVTQQPRYLIEYIGRVGAPPPTSYSNKKPDTRQFAFRITAIGWGEGAAPSARYMVQSSFRMPLI